MTVFAELSVLHLLQKIAKTQLMQETGQSDVDGTPKSQRASIVSQKIGHESVTTSINDMNEDEPEWEEGLELSARPELSRSMLVRMGRDQNILGKEEECLLRNLMENDRSNSLI